MPRFVLVWLASRCAPKGRKTYAESSQLLGTSSGRGHFVWSRIPQANTLEWVASDKPHGAIESELILQDAAS